MSDNQFIIDNLKQGQSCREMVLSDYQLFNQDNYNVIKGLIEENSELTHIAANIYFKQSSVKYKQITADRNEEYSDKIFDGVFCQNTVMVPINRQMSPHLATCEIIEKIFNFIKPCLNFH